MQSSGTLPAKDLVQYGLLAFPLACFGLPLYIHTPDFYATEFGLSLGALGVVLLLLRLFDAVQDPVIGYCLDKFSRHHAAISAVSLIALGASFLALYVPPVKPGIVWFASCVAIATTAFSVLIIQLNSLGSLWGQTLTQKTQVATVREGFGVGGLLAATILPAFLLLSMTPASAYGLYAFFFAGVLAVSGFFYIFWLRRHQQTFPVFKKIAFSLKSLRVSGELRRFYLVYAFSIFASSLPAVLVLFFIRDYLQAEQYTGLFLFIYFLSAVCSMPIWKKVISKVGLVRSWLGAMAGSVLVFVWAYFLGEGDIGAYGIVCALSGFFLGAELSCPPAILSSLIDKAGQQDKTSVLFSVLAFLSKLALALATSVGLMALNEAGFVPAEANTPHALGMLALLYALIPCAVKTLSCFLLWPMLSTERISHETPLSPFPYRSDPHV